MSILSGHGRPLRHDAYSHRATSPAVRGRSEAAFSSPVKRGRWRVAIGDVTEGAFA
jgi:hypothetical protein